MIFLKILAFFAVLIGIGMLLMMIFAGNPTMVGIILIVTVSLGGFAVADLAAFFIRLICKTEKIKNYWKSFFSLLIASAAVESIGVVFKVFLPNVPFVDTASQALSIILLAAAALNLAYNALYILFGTGKLTIPWKLFIFFLVLSGIFGTVYIFSDYLNEKFFNGSGMLSTVSLMSLSGSLLLAVASLLAAIVSGIFSKNRFNTPFKLFLSLIIIAGCLSGVSGLFHLINRPWRNALMFTAGAVLLLGVAVLIVIVFRTIFLDKPFCRNENYREYDDEEDYDSDSSDITVDKWICAICNTENESASGFCCECGSRNPKDSLK